MHEYSIVQALVARVEEAARAHGAVAVKRVRVRVGEMSGVDPDLLVTAYETFRGEDVLCREAPLEVERVPVRWACRACGRPIAEGEVLRCPACGGAARLEAGDEILLSQVELEVP